MEYITAHVDLVIIRDDIFVRKSWIWIEKLAMADEVVFLFDLLNPSFGKVEL